MHPGALGAGTLPQYSNVMGVASVADIRRRRITVVSFICCCLLQECSGSVLSHGLKQWKLGASRMKTSHLKRHLNRIMQHHIGTSDKEMFIGGQTITAEYYSSLMVQFKDILKEKRRGKFPKGIVFLHDNAPAHRALATR